MKIKINTHGNEMPYQHETDWIDLRAAEDMHMIPEEFAIIPLGVSMELPEGYEAHVCARSSTFKNWGIIMVNGMGIIDEGYCGDDDIWGFPAYATRAVTIHKGDRIAQFRIVKKQPTIEFEQVDNLGNESRGGFWSTGEN